MSAPVLVQQFTPHLIHLDHSYRLSYLLRQFADKTGKIISRKQTKHKRKNKHNSTRGKYFSLFRTVMIHCDRPRSNCLLSWVEAVSRCCRPIGDLANSSRAPACTFKVVHSSLSSTPMSDLHIIHSCSVPVNFKNPSMLVSRGKVLPPPLMFQTAILRAHLTPYRSRATVATFRVPLVPYRPRRVAAMDHIAATRVARE